MTTIAANALFLVPGQVGGTETYLRRTLSAMPPLLAPDERLAVFANAENADALAADIAECGAGADRVSLVRTGIRATSRARRILFENSPAGMPRALRRAGADVVWNPGNAALLRAPCPQATTIHDMQYKRFPEDFSPAALMAMRLLVPSAVRRSEVVLAVSEFSKREILHFVPGTPGDRIVVTREAADPLFSARIPAAEARARAAALCGIGPGEPFVLAVSNSYPHKSLETAVEAFGKISGDFPHRLVAVGRPRRGEPALRAALDALPDRSRAIRLEYADRAGLAALYAAADVLVFPSLYEGFGLPVLEAMSAGLPVVAAAEGSVPEVCGDAAVYARGRDAADFARAVATLLSDPAARARAAAAGRARAAAFSWEKTAAATLEAVRLAAKRGRGPDGGRGGVTASAGT